MFRTIFGKLIVVFVSILILSFSTTGVLLYYFLGNFVSSEKVKELEQVEDGVNKLLAFYLDNRDSSLARVLFEGNLETYQARTSSIIWIVDPNGEIFISKPDIRQLSEGIAGKLKKETANYKLPDKRQYEKVMLRQEGSIQEIGNFYGLLEGSWLVVEKPFVYNNETIAAVYMLTPMPKIHEARTSVFRFYIISVGVSVLISIFLTYIFSLRITKPLKKINNAARVIAAGEFQNRLDIRTRDEIGELADSFNHMASALQNLENMRRGFVANVSHELRTPMTSIRGFVEGILDGTIPPERHRNYLMIVRDETNRLNRMTNDLLDLAKMESGELQLNMRVFDINELIRRCIIKLETQITGKELELEADFTDEELNVKADPDAIERVLINLLHNAIKFTPEKGRIFVSTSIQDGNVLVAVQDTGAGIRSDEINLIWERFYKTDKSRGNDKSGTGLGLAIVKNIINEHNQEIWVESELDRGARFCFTLELAEKNQNQS